MGRSRRLSLGSSLDRDKGAALILRLMQDGDDEGCLRLIDLPTPDQAIVIRDVIGLRKRTELGHAELERRRGLEKLLAQAQRLPSSPTPLPTPAQPSHQI